jgi:hypothetical protein
MSRKKVSTTIYITTEQAELLKVLHERSKVPIAVYIREGIDMVLAKYQDRLPGQLTLEAGRDAGLSGHGRPSADTTTRDVRPAPESTAGAKK